jgi:hypothetical protein
MNRHHGMPRQIVIDKMADDMYWNALARQVLRQHQIRFVHPALIVESTRYQNPGGGGARGRHTVAN